MGVTLKDVAERAGVSLSTVSRAFSHPHVLAPDTMHRILAISKELQYRPNTMARALITGVSRNIGLVAPDISNPYATALLKSAQSHARARGLSMLVADTDEDLAGESGICAEIAQQSDGLILFAPRMRNAQIRQLSTQVSTADATGMSASSHPESPLYSRSTT